METKDDSSNGLLRRSQTMRGGMTTKPDIPRIETSNACFTSTASLPSTFSRTGRRRGRTLIRRCTSDTSVWQAKGANPRSGSLLNYRRKATVLMAQRSNASGVRNLVTTMDRKCKNARANSSVPELSPSDDPFSECAILSYIADDAYYRVVLGSANCVSVLIKTMKLFPLHINLQEACCTALGKLCNGSGSNQTDVKTEDGVQQIVIAMRTHSSSIAVQSAACAALRQMSALLTEPTLKPDEKVMKDIITLLNTAKGMYITPVSKAQAEELLSVLQARHTSPTRSS
mmetsp:Transcript_20052/g.29744  ORF Transcript_20052/g.29744 Transcript_20052/m.29744 type:complete len:286 (+) Transcript_20052:232-1089(+)